MEQLQKLIQIYNIFYQIETKGQSTKSMASCMVLMEEVINDIQAQESKDNKTTVDATYGRRTRAVLIMDSGHVILSAIQPETVGARIDKNMSQEDIAKQLTEN